MNLNKSPQSSIDPMQDESALANLKASMMKESFVDLDHSRNDVVPQRT